MKELESNNRLTEAKIKNEIEIYREQIVNLKQRVTKCDSEATQYSHKLDLYNNDFNVQKDQYESMIKKVENAF